MIDDPWKCVITPCVRPYKLRSTKWVVRLGRRVDIDATVDPWEVWVTARPTKRHPNPKRRKLGQKAAEKLLAGLRL